ncbi:MAG: hypothetical protein AB8C84_05450 [Oligoflexales bacterium]
MKYFQILFIIPLLIHCGLTLKSPKHTHKNKKTEPRKQIALLHIDQNTLNANDLFYLNPIKERKNIVLVVNYSLVLPGNTSSLSLTTQPTKFSKSTKDIKVSSDVSHSQDISKRDAFIKDKEKKEPKFDPIEGSKKIITAKDINQHSTLTNHDVYINRKKKVFDFAKVPKGIEVFRGMKITKATANILLNKGIDSPAVFNFKTGAISPDTLIFNTIKKHHLGTGLEGKTQQSLFVSTSYDKSIALQFAENGGVVFKIRTPEARSVDVNKALGDKVFYPEEKEVAIIGNVHPKDILGYYPVIPGSPPKLGEFQCKSPCTTTQ